MARSIWTGSLSFGLVNVPVKLYSATEQKDVRFHQFEKDTGRRVRNMRVAEGTDEEVPYEDVVKGYEISDGKWVMLEPEELESVEPGRSRTIDLEDFVDISEIDPVHFEKPYWLGPVDDSGAERAYRLLLDAMAEAGRAGIARFVMRGKQYLAAIRPAGDVLALHTMYFPDEVRDPAKEIDNLPVKVETKGRELKIALQLIDSLTVDWDAGRYHDSYRERVLELIDRKAKGEAIEVAEPEEVAPVVDLLAALEASLGEDGKAAKGKGRRKGRAARSSGAKASDELEELTADELQKRAKAAGVSGRSRMKKDELVEAIRDAS